MNTKYYQKPLQFPDNILRYPKVLEYNLHFTLANLINNKLFCQGLTDLANRVVLREPLTSLTHCKLYTSFRLLLCLIALLNYLQGPEFVPTCNLKSKTGSRRV